LAENWQFAEALHEFLAELAIQFLTR